MSITNFLDRQVRLEGHDSVIYSSDINTNMLRLESAFEAFIKVKGIHSAAMHHNLSTEEIKLGQHVLSTIPQEFQPAGMRMEGYSNTLEGLRYRSENIFETIGNAISKFFKWISDAFSKLFGGDDSSSSGTTAASVDAVVKATDEIVTSASANGTDEFFFATGHKLQGLLNLADMAACGKYFDAVVESSKALVKIHAEAIKLSKEASKEYQGDYQVDVVKNMKAFSVPLSPAYYAPLKKDFPDFGEDSLFFYPVSFLEAKPIAFVIEGTTAEIKMPNPNVEDGKDGNKGGKLPGYTPKDEYVNVGKYKELTRKFETYTKAFGEAKDDIEKVAKEYAGLEKQVKDWMEMKPEVAKSILGGIQTLNNVAKFTLAVVSKQESNMASMVRTFQDLVTSEDGLRKQAKAGRKKEGEDAKAKSDAEEKAKADAEEKAKKGDKDPKGGKPGKTFNSMTNTWS